jgi:zona occludens toxin
MSILAYTGIPGSGKSYAVVEHQILPALRAGRIVVTNVPVKADLIRKDIPSADIRDFPIQTIATQPELMAEVVPPGAIFVLDEVWRLFPSGVKANQVPEQFRSFFAEHRHRMDAGGNSTQIVLVTQDLAQIGAFARQLVEQTFRITKLSTLGIPMSNRYRVDMYAGPVAGPNPPQNGRIRQVFGRYDKKVWQYYDSHTQSEAGEGAIPNEKGVDARANAFKRPFYVALPFLTVALVVGIVWGCVHLKHKFQHVEKTPATDSAVMSGANHASVGTGGPPTPSLLTRGEAKLHGADAWRVVGTLENLAHPERSYAVLADGLGRDVRRTRVAFKQCINAGDQGVRCPFEGFWYSELGLTEVKAEDEPIKIWTQKSAHVVAPVVPVPVNPPESTHNEAGGAVEGSAVLLALSVNKAGLDDPRRPVGTFRGVAAR